MLQRASILKYLTDHRKPVRFWLAAALGLGVAIGANALPCFLTRGACYGDGYEVIGFPFVFRRLGGIEGTHEFSHLALSTDIVLALLFSVFAGNMTNRWLDHRARRGRFAWCAGPPPRRPPWQFSLRQLLLIVAVVAVACAADKCIAVFMSQWPVSSPSAFGGPR